MNSKNRLLSYIFFVTGVAVLGAVGLFAWHTSLAEKVVLGSSVPPEIAGFPLAQEISGQEAIDSIHELHGKDFVLVDGAVAAYGVQNVILWVSDAGSESAAADLTDLMKVRIAEGRSPFSDQGSFDVDGFLVYALDGLGQTHYYWQSGRLVLWLAADYDIALSALQETVRFYRP